MKRKILVVVLCLACAASYAQTHKKKKPKPHTTTTTKPQQQAQQQANTVGNANGTTTTSLQPVDTTKKKPAAGPQKPFDRPVDGYFVKSDILNAKVTPYPSIREADAAYEKRIWREIDLREKMNSYMASPKMRLIDVIMDAVMNGELTAYDPTAAPAKGDPDGDGFATPLTPAQAKSRMADSSMVDDFDAQGNKKGSHMVAGEFSADSIVKFRIKEDWIFDKQRSVFEPRIVGIAPMVKPKAGGVDLDYQPAFWIYFKDLRPILATKEVVNRDNDNTGLSFDDVFNKRIFTSYIVKESNDKDLRIKDYMTGVDKLYESDRIKKQLMDWEINLWQY